MTGTKFTNLKNVLQFLYTGEINIAKENLDSFLNLAKYLGLQALTEKSEENFKLNDFDIIKHS